MRLFVEKPLCKFQMLTYTIAMSDLDETLIMQGLDAMYILLKIWVDLMIDLTMLELMGVFVPSIM